MGVRGQPDDTPLIAGEFVPHDSRLQFGAFNYSQRDEINSEPACPTLPANRTYGAHRGIDAIDPIQTASPIDSPTRDQYNLGYYIL